MMRKYGSEPFLAAVVHCGPGAMGSVACVAKELSKAAGIIEPIQSKYTIPELITELYEQISSVTKYPITLIGHSWGAWLIVLFAKNYPEMVKQLVLVGSGPFEQKYAGMIMERRLKNLSEDEQILFINSIAQLNDTTIANKDMPLRDLGRLTEKADNYCIAIQAFEEALKPNSKMYSAIWQQAEALRKSNELYASLKMLKCPVVVLHGELDPHPAEGVIQPLSEQGVCYEAYILPRCGHSPFKEKVAAEQFYEILLNVIQRAK